MLQIYITELPTISDAINNDFKKNTFIREMYIICATMCCSDRSR